MRIPIGISNKHVHLSQEHLEKLFGKGYELKKLKDLTQPGDFAAQEVITIQGPVGKFDNVRVVGPARKFTQVEVMVGHTFVLGIEPVIRISGDIKGTPGLKLIGPAGSVDLSEGVIVAKRHLHCTVKEAQDMGLKNGDNIKIKVEGVRGLIFDNIEVRAKDNYALDCHVDIEEANAAGLSVGAWGELIS